MQNTTAAAPAPKPTYSLLWDESAIIDDKAKDLLESGIAETESEAFEMASLDYDFIEWEFDDFLEEFGRILHRISSKGQYFVEGENMGWRHLSGWAIVEAEDARAFMSRAFPKTSDWTLRGQFDRKRRVLTYTLSHHDAPTGELYTVRACRAEDRRRQ
ncbi:MAG TPA: hypothetical protein DEA55_00345 [Rhodospirillaceae bacterium]|nr:hypothetical protein [Rhodospirillaceae bacterium]